MNGARSGAVLVNLGAEEQAGGEVTAKFHGRDRLVAIY